MTRPPPPRVSSRTLAASVVARVFGHDAFLSDTLDRELARARLAPKDAALATELSYGVVRTEAALRRRLEAIARQGLAPGDPLTQAHLLVAAYQLLALDRVPAFAATNEAVGALRALRGPRVAAFANAVLRHLARAPADWNAAEARRETLPTWLWARLVEAVGECEALQLIGGQGDRPYRGQCIRLVGRGARDRALPPWLEGAQPGRLVPDAFWVSAQGDLRARSEYSDGQFALQDEGAQWCASALGVQPGDRVLDACAGHGGKAAWLAERMGAGELWVVDRSRKKLVALQHEFQRLKLPPVHARALDFAHPQAPEQLPGPYDRVLVDAPCSGTGTLRRRPEIARRLRAEDPARLAELAVPLLRNAARLTKPGGTVLFVVCSVLREECEAVLDRVASVLAPVAFPRAAPEGLLSTAFHHARLLPSRTGTDAYFAAALRPV